MWSRPGANNRSGNRAACSSLDHDRSVEHVHAADKPDLASDFRRELDRDGLIERQRTPDIERWKHNLLCAGLIRCPQEGDPHSCARSHRQLCGFESLFRDDDLRVLYLRDRVGSHSDTILLGAHGEAPVSHNAVAGLQPTHDRYVVSGTLAGADFPLDEPAWLLRI